MFTLITGGVKSGKSRFALSLAENLSNQKNLYFVATAIGLDGEMKKRIALHREERGQHWKTIEEPLALDKAIAGIPEKSTILVDCLTVWLGNIFTEKGISDFNSIKGIFERIRTNTGKKESHVIFVSNEVGWGIIPDQAFSRAYGECLGSLNQWLSQHAKQVFLVVSGIPLEIKSGYHQKFLFTR